MGLGWVPDLPDLRDKTVNGVVPTLSKGLLGPALHGGLPRVVSLRSYCSDVEDQETLGSCTAHAVVGMVEYLMRRGGKPHVEASRLFLYKATRKLLGWTGDTGAYLRSTIKALAAFGVPPEENWPYLVDRYEDEPDAFLYAYAANYKALNYARLDEYRATGDETLDRVKKAIRAGFVVAFGFPVYSSLSVDPDIPYPEQNDRLQGGHAVLAVGYDDSRPIGGSQGALEIRNSWGVEWGDQGYGWLPFDYVINQLANDFWVVIKEDWLDPAVFEDPR